MAATYGRSPQEIAEDMVIAMCSPVYNVSRADAERFSIQLREVGRDLRQQAERLLDAWEGSSAQIAAAMSLWPVWRYATREFRKGA